MARLRSVTRDRSHGVELARQRAERRVVDASTASTTKRVARSRGKFLLDRRARRRDRSAVRAARRRARPSRRRPRRRLPALDRLSSVQRNEMREPRRERIRIGEDSARTRPSRSAMRSARGVSSRMHGSGAHRGEQRVGQLHRADPLALRFDVDGRARIEALERGAELAVERLLRGLRLAGQVAEQRPAMPRERFEIEHLRADRRRARSSRRLLPDPVSPQMTSIAKLRRQRRRAARSTWRR